MHFTLQELILTRGMPSDGPIYRVQSSYPNFVGRADVNADCICAIRAMTLRNEKSLEIAINRLGGRLILPWLGQNSMAGDASISASGGSPATAFQLELAVGNHVNARAP